MMKVLVLSALCAVSTALNLLDLQPFGLKATRSLEELHYEPAEELDGGFLTVYTGTDNLCRWQWNVQAEVVAVDKCLLGSNTSYPGTMFEVATSQFSNYFFITQTTYHDRECTDEYESVYFYVPYDVCFNMTETYNYYTRIEYSEDFPETLTYEDDSEVITQRSFDDFTACYEVDEYSENANNAVQANMYAYDECVFTADREVMKFTTCIKSGEGVYAKASYVTMEVYENYADCMNENVTAKYVTEMSSLDCDGVNGYGAALSLVSRVDCENMDIESEDDAESDVVTAAFDGFVIFKGYSFNSSNPSSEATCSDEEDASVMQIIATNACVRTTDTFEYDDEEEKDEKKDGHIYMQLVVSTTTNETSMVTTTWITINTYARDNCTEEATMSWAVHPSCVATDGSITNPCTFAINEDECNEYSPYNEEEDDHDEDVTNTFQWSFSESFPALTNEHNIVHKYYQSLDLCNDENVEGLSSAVIMNIDQCQFNDALLLVDNMEYPDVEGAAYAVTNCEGLTYTIEMYDPNTCGEQNLQLTFDQPRYQCTATEKGYMTSYCKDYSKHEIGIPKDAAYAFLLFLLLLPLVFYALLKMCEVCGCHSSSRGQQQSSSPQDDDQKVSYGNQL